MQVKNSVLEVSVIRPKAVFGTMKNFWDYVLVSDYSAFSFSSTELVEKPDMKNAKVLVQVVVAGSGNSSSA